MNSDSDCSAGSNSSSHSPHQYHIPLFYQEKARKELFESPQEIPAKLEQLRSLLLQGSSCQGEFSDAFLIRFLRHRKWDVEKALRRIQTYYAVRRDLPYIFADLTPRKVKDLLERGVSNVLPQRDRDGCRIVIYRPGIWSPHIGSGDILDLARLNLIIMAYLLEEEETQIAGISFIVDCSDMSFKHMLYTTSTYIQVQREIMSRALPVRVNKVLILHGGKVFDTIFSLLSTLISRKLLRRVKNCGENLTRFHAELCPILSTPSTDPHRTKESVVYDRSILPSDAIFGGCGLHSLPDHNFVENLLRFESTFLKGEEGGVE